MKDSTGKSILRRGRAAAMAAAVTGTVLLAPFRAMPVKAASPLEDGELWIGNTQVTEENCADIFGDGMASYDPATLTLTLNGVHIGPDDCHIVDAGGNAQPEMSRTQTNWGIYSLYAKNTVAHLVVNGKNTFETPVIEREMYTDAGLANDHRSRVSRQLEIWDGIVIDCSGLAVNRMSVTGSGTLRSYTPAIAVQEEFNGESDTGSLGMMNQGQGGMGLFWDAGDVNKTLTVGTSGKAGPVLDLRGGVAGMTLHNVTVDVYNANLTFQALKGKNYGGTDSPCAWALYNSYSQVNLYENTKMRANTKERDNSGDQAEIYVTRWLSNQVTLLDGDDRQTCWYQSDVTGDVNEENRWVVWGTARGEEAARAAEEAAKRRNPGVDPMAENYADTDIDVLGFSEDVVVYSVDVEWGAMTFQYENSTWDPAEHKTVTGAGWKVYDSEKGETLNSGTESVNRIQVTNHSNAAVWATLDYAGTDGYEDTAGCFEKKADDTATDFNAAGRYLFLGTADNSGEEGVAGTPTVGTVYFMPDGIKEEYKKADGIAKWRRLGMITVGIETEEP